MRGSDRVANAGATSNAVVTEKLSDHAVFPLRGGQIFRNRWIEMARAKALIANDPLRRWTVADALDLYNIPRWGCGYFSIDPTTGSLIVTPRGEGGGTINMKELVDELTGRGIQLPILLRFSDILRARIELICGAFNGAMREYGYTGQYRG